MYKGNKGAESFNNYGVKEEPLTQAEEIFHYKLVTKKNPEKKAWSWEVRKKIIEKGIVDETQARKDDLYLERAKRNFSEVTQRSEILEAVLAKIIEDNAWFGDDSFTVSTLEYDDVANHTDFVIEIKTEQGEVLRIAIDATVSDEEEVFEKKKNFVVDELAQGYGTIIKYFESQAEYDENDDFKLMKVKSAPRAIIAYRKDNLAHLCKSMAGIFKPGQKKETYQMLEKSGLQLYIIQEMIDQFEWQIARLRSLGKHNSDIGRNLEKVIKYLKNLNEIKKDRIRVNPHDESLKVAKIDYSRH